MSVLTETHRLQVHCLGKWRNEADVRQHGQERLGQLSSFKLVLPVPEEAKASPWYVVCQIQAKRETSTTVMKCCPDLILKRKTI